MSAFRTLTARECEVLQAYVDGAESRSQVGKKLGISHRTVGNHLANIMEKFDVETTLAAVVEALRAGRVTL